MRLLCLRAIALLTISICSVGAAALAEEVSVEATKDTTLYESPSGTIANGSGQYFFAGRTNQGFIRRGLVAFDVAGSVPDGAKVTSVTLELNMSKTITGPQTVALHRLLSDWGEGASDAENEEGNGTAPERGDATWVHIYFDSQFWPGYSFGGLFERQPSAMTPVGREGVYTWGSTTQMVADVQAWVDDPSSNYGWILVGEEGNAGTAKRFDSKDHPEPSFRPRLIVEIAGDGMAETPSCSVSFSSPYECAGASTTVMPQGTGEAGEADVVVQWNGPCAIADPASPVTTAECDGTGEFLFTLDVTTDGDGDGMAGAEEPTVSCDLLAVVQDTDAPDLAVPDAVLAECGGEGGATVELMAGADDTCGTASVANSRTGDSGDASGVYALGTHTVAWTAEDDADNLAAGWTDVTVVDTASPTLTCAATAEPVGTTGGHPGQGDPWGDPADEDADEDMDEDADEDDDCDDDGGEPAPFDTLRIHVAGADACCHTTTHAVLDLGCAQLTVTDGQLVGIRCLDPAADADCAVSVDDQGVLVLDSTSISLTAETADCAGNSTACSVDLCGGDDGTPATATALEPVAGSGSGTAGVGGNERGSTAREGTDGAASRRTIQRRPTIR
jgi:hypothetical protein